MTARPLLKHRHLVHRDAIPLVFAQQGIKQAARLIQSPRLDIGANQVELGRHEAGRLAHRLNIGLPRSLSIAS
ncbi:hypothetical protein SDC9_174175 [bioreactor metagenome]|uniref:Uncharacterized protein n=1 Tax=bioreactor metagenome TaxID=1076179 RepID=A0A645GKT0_9ZZZZ